ncbi:MAG: hypothetical protein K8T91_03840 [Planctomycetes bacterium]|nr:hypothetical protein [Planctomycetota bacterium]
MSFGDSRAALVVQIAPHLIVAAYTDEQDAVLLLQFPDFLTDQYALHVGSRLLTVNTYGEAKRVAADIVEGPACTHRYANLYPLIAEFLSDDLNLISQRKQSIVEAEWNRAAQFAQARLAAKQVVVRDGRPLYSHLPAKAIVLSSSSAH